MLYVCVTLPLNVKATVLYEIITALGQCVSWMIVLLGAGQQLKILLSVVRLCADNDLFIYCWFYYEKIKDYIN